MPQFSPDDIAAVALTLLAGSEILSFLPGVKANGWVQLILGILRGMLHVLEEGGRLDLQWAGSPAAFLAADENGGGLVLLDPEGNVRGSLPEGGPDEDDTEA